MSYHLRVTMEREEADKVLDKFVEKFKPITYVFSYEEVEDNHHIHGHLEYDAIPKRQTISDFFKRHNLSGCYYHKEIEKEPINNLLYVLKDLDIIDHNLEQERYDTLIETTKRINDDKKKQARHKLLEIIEADLKPFFEREPKQSENETMDEYEKYMEAYQEWASTCPYLTLSDIADRIMSIYIDDYDKEPPLAHMRGYVLYIAHKIHKRLPIVRDADKDKQFIPLEYMTYWKGKF